MHFSYIKDSCLFFLNASRQWDLVVQLVPPFSPEKPWWRRGAAIHCTSWEAIDLRQSYADVTGTGLDGHMET